MITFDPHNLFPYSLVQTIISQNTTTLIVTVIAGNGSRFSVGQQVVLCPPSTMVPLPTNAMIGRITAISTDTLTINISNSDIPGTTIPYNEGSSYFTVIQGWQIGNVPTNKIWKDLENLLNGIVSGVTLLDPTFNVGSDATGDIHYRNSSGLLARLGLGSNGQVLEIVSGLPAWTTPAAIGSNGWTPDTNVLTYASPTSFTVPGNQTTQYTKGTRIMFTNNSTTFYGVVLSSSYSSPNTTVTLFATSDYSIANSAITNPYYSYQVNPQGYPNWFNYTGETWNGFSTNPTGGTYRYSVIGNTITVQLGRGSGVSNATTMYATLPVNSAQSVHFGQGIGYDNGAYVSNNSPAYLAQGTNELFMYKVTDQTNQWTSSGNKNWIGTISYEF